MSGLAKLYFQNQDVYDGFLEKYQMTGEGYLYDSERDSWIFGKFKEDQCAEILHSGPGYPHKQSLGFRAGIHRLSEDFVEGHVSQINFDIDSLKKLLKSISVLESITAVISTAAPSQEVKPCQFNPSYNKAVISEMRFITEMSHDEKNGAIISVSLSNTSFQSKSNGTYPESMPTPKDKGSFLLPRDLKSTDVGEGFKTVAEFSSQNRPKEAKSKARIDLIKRSRDILNNLQKKKTAGAKAEEKMRETKPEIVTGTDTEKDVKIVLEKGCDSRDIGSPKVTASKAGLRNDLGTSNLPQSWTPRGPDLNDQLRRPMTKKEIKLRECFSPSRALIGSSIEMIPRNEGQIKHLRSTLVQASVKSPGRLIADEVFSKLNFDKNTVVQFKDKERLRDNQKSLQQRQISPTLTGVLSSKLEKYSVNSVVRFKSPERALNEIPSEKEKPSGSSILTGENRNSREGRVQFSDRSTKGVLSMLGKLKESKQTRGTNLAKNENLIPVANVLKNTTEVMLQNSRSLSLLNHPPRDQNLHSCLGNLKSVLRNSGEYKKGLNMPGDKNDSSRAGVKNRLSPDCSSRLPRSPTSLLSGIQNRRIQDTSSFTQFWSGDKGDPNLADFRVSIAEE